MPTRSVDRLAVTNKNSRANLCSFTFADGRRCRTPRYSRHTRLCYFHARKEAQARAADEVGRDISSFLSGSYLSACDLNSALGRLFIGVARGHVKPKRASTLAYLAQTLVQSIKIAEEEYINAFSTDFWRETVRSSFDSQSAEAEECEDVQEQRPQTQENGPQPAAK